MEFIAVIGLAALAAWGVSVERRCLNARSRRWLMGLSLALMCWLVASAALGGIVLQVGLVSCSIAVVAIEAMLAARVIPSVRGFRTFFQHLPLDLRIIAPGGREIYRTNITRKLDAPTLWHLASNKAAPGESPVLSTRIESLPHTTLKIYHLSAGVAVLAEDTSEIDELQRQLEERRDELIARNELLRNQQAMQVLVHRQLKERELYECVERDLAETTQQINAIFEELMEADGLPAAEDAANAGAWHRERLNLVKVLVAYGKRKGMLALAQAEADTMESAQLELIAREAMADLRSIGIECAVLVAASRPMAMDAVNTVYDSFYDCIISVLPQSSPVIMVYISQADDASLTMRATIECAIGLDSATAAETIPQIATSTEAWTAVQQRMARELERRLALRGGAFTIDMEDGLVNVAVTTRPMPTAEAAAPPRAKVPAESQAEAETSDRAGTAARTTAQATPAGATAPTSASADARAEGAGW